MSMIGNFKSCSDDKLKDLLNNPSDIESFLYPEEFDENDPTELDIDKAWQAIHFLLTDSPYEGDKPLNFITMGGVEVGDFDIGYGPARAFSSKEVKEIAKALENISGECLKKKFSPDVFNENGIYPDIWDEEVEECMDKYVINYYNDLKNFIKTTSDNSQALLVYVN